MGVNHYENFPVASLLLPGRLRSPVQAIYHFARSADDIADEGDATAADRLAALDGYRVRLREIDAGSTPDDPIFGPLAHVIRQYRLPLGLFFDLLDAFAQDVVRARYRDFADLRDYCRRSADPVGRLLLRLFDVTDSNLMMRSDQICTSLQLINFLQDVASDFRRGRIYLPQDEMHSFGIAEHEIGDGPFSDAWRSLMLFQIQRARSMMLDGAPLASCLPGRIGLELRMIVAGGLRILEKLQAVGGDVFRRRPVLSATDWPLMLWRAALPRKS